MSEVIKCVIFDLDGTLVDAYKAVASSMNYALGQLGQKPVNSDLIKRTVGRGDRHLISTFVGKQNIDKALSIFREHHKRALKEGVVLLPGARKLLEELKAGGYKLTIASNRPTRFTHIILKHLNLEGIFDYVLCADKVANPKPAADLLVQTLKKYAFKPTQALYVGDMAIDVETGHNAGVKTVAVVTGSCTKAEVAELNPHKIIDHVYDVAQILKNEQNELI